MGYIGNSPVTGAARVLEGSGTGDGTTVAFAMGFSPAAEQEVFVFLDGSKQDTDAYSISGSTCTFTAAPMTSENIDFIGFEVGKATVPQENSVDASKVVDGSITQAKLAQDATSIGVGQTWQNVTGSRSWNTTYYNTTGKPIMVSISAGTNSGTVYVHVNGVQVMYSKAVYSDIDAFQIIVPNDGSYIATGTGALNSWSELR